MTGEPVRKSSHQQVTSRQTPIAPLGGQGQCPSLFKASRKRAAHGSRPSRRGSQTVLSGAAETEKPHRQARVPRREMLLPVMHA